MSQAKEEVFNFAQPGEYVIKHVQGAPEHTPNRISHTGRVDAPRTYIEPKKANYDVLRATVVIDSDEGSVKLTLGEKDSDPDSITGKLEPDATLAALGINNPKKQYDPRELWQELKRLGQFFPDKGEYVKVLAQLNNFTASVKKAYEDTANPNGNAKKSVETIVEGFQPLYLDMVAPIFKGDERQAFKVEIDIDASSGAVKLYLDSNALYELDYNRRREVLGQEAEFFKTWGAAVIFKS